MARAGLSADVVTRAGADLADEIGFDAVSLSELARRFDVRVASLYSHVASSHDLRVRITVLALGEIADRAAAALAGRSGRAALAALADTYRDYARRHPGRWAATELRFEPDEAARAVGARHSALLLAVLRGYHLDPDEQTHAVRLIGSWINGFVALERAGGFDHSRPDGEASWRRLIDVLDGLLQAWPEP